MEEKVEVKVTEFANATSFKMKNKRVMVRTLPTKEFVIELKLLVEKGTSDVKRSVHISQKDVITITGMKVSLEAAMSIMLGLQRELKRAGAF